MGSERRRWYHEGYYREETLSTAFLQAARNHGSIKYCFWTQSTCRETTVAEICARAWRVAGALQALGLRAGDVFALQLPTSFETAVLYVAAFHVGAVVVPIVHTYGSSEIDFILRDSGATWMAVPDRWRNVDCVNARARRKSLGRRCVSGKQSKSIHRLVQRMTCAYFYTPLERQRAQKVCVTHITPCVQNGRFPFSMTEDRFSIRFPQDT
jgi:long-subunit acyl-CoA synthetase (AMP-forming)